MRAYSLVIELSDTVKNQLATLCFGPPQIKWVKKEEIYFLIRSFGELSPLELKDVSDQLDNLFFHPFIFNMRRGVKSTQFKGIGIIGIEPVSNPALVLLNKEIDQLLRKLNLKKNVQPFPLILGYYDKLSFERLSDYLASYVDFEALSVEVTGLSLIETRPSFKGAIHEEIAYYPATNQDINQD